MAFTNQERINAVTKALLGNVMDADAAAQWYEAIQSFGFALDSRQVWTQANLVKAAPAVNLVAAQANCAGPLAGIVEDLSLVTAAVRLTAVPGVNNTFAALTVYGDWSSGQLLNWLKPQFVPQASGLPSFGYAMRLFNGDPNGGGVEVMTTDGATGTGVNKSVGWIFNYDNGLLLLASDFAATVPDPYIMAFRYIGTTAGGGVAADPIAVMDEGVLIEANLRELNFIGADVISHGPGAPVGRVNVYIPPPPFFSHWNTDDGANGAQFVTESITRTSARISTPNVVEGNPFATGGWAGTLQPTTRQGVVTFTTPNETIGFGGTSTMQVQVYDADGVTLLGDYTTPAITGNGVHTSLDGTIEVTITDFAAQYWRFVAKSSIRLNMGGIFTLNGRAGGRYHVRTTHFCDPATDPAGPFNHVQTDVFYDTDPGGAPAISSTVTVGETIFGPPLLTKHLSGVEYYINGSQFTVDVQGIDRLNSNTQRPTNNLTILGTDYGFPGLNLSPFGIGAANFVGWTNNDNVNGVQYLQDNWAIAALNYRYMGPTGNIAAYPQDPWNTGATVSSANAPILIDTHLTTSTVLAEYFDDEARREAHTNFPGVGTWISTATLAAGEAQVWNSSLVVPNSTTLIRLDGPNDPNADWTLYKPNAGGPNPDYSLLGAPVNYGRRFTKTPGELIPSFTIVFSGTFVGGNALADIVSGDLEVYVYRIDGLGNIGAPPGNLFPLRVHEPFNFAVWDDGATVAGSGIREASSSGNTINCTFGTGTPADTGFYCHVRILNSAIRIDSMVVTFY